MDIKEMKLPIIVLSIGLILMLAAYMLTSAVLVPTITSHDFAFSVTYRYNGEVRTLENVCRCYYNTSESDAAPLDRWFYTDILDQGLDQHAYAYTFAEQDGYDLCIVTYFNAWYMMGDTTSESYDEGVEEPYFIAYDAEGVAYEEEGMLSQFDVEILSWDYPEPIENTFNFVGFSSLYEGNTLAMLFVILLLLGACAIFVKKDPVVLYTTLDKVSFGFNLVIGILGVPFFALRAILASAFQIGPDWLYQVYLIIPLITAFSLVLSLVFRRKELTRTGFFIQFVGPVLFVATIFLEGLL